MGFSLELLPRYLLTFGPWKGLICFLKVELMRSEKVRPGGFQHPIRLRSETTDVLVFREVFLFKSYDIDIGHPRVIVDGGANIGLTSLFLASKHKGCRIYAVEPDTANYQALCMNTRFYPSIVPVHSALWNKDTSLRIKTAEENNWAFQVMECSPGQPQAIQGISISTLMSQFSIDRIDVLKLDIEGSEKELFTDNYEYWITRTKVIIIELHDWIKDGCSRTVFRVLSAYRFNVKIANGMLVFINMDIG